jgi:hypothetical protein
MWDIMVVVVQLACFAVLIAGAAMSLWFWRLASTPRPNVEPESPPVATTEAIAKPMQPQPLKRAA